MPSFSGGTPRVAAVALTALLALSTRARADQFIVADETYTHSKDTTSDSHYRVAPRAGTPKDWTKPVDWTKGSAHVRLEVKTKPGATPTKFQICFEGTPSYACTYQSDAYTKPGTYQWTTPFTGFWSPEGNPMQWANGVTKVALILKDENNGKPQGNPSYVPTDLHVEVAIVSEGSTYQLPGAGPPDAAVPTQDAGPNDASVRQEPPVDAAVRPPDLPRRDASAPVVRTDASMTEDKEPPEPIDASIEPASADSSKGCALAGEGSQGWLALLALAWLRRRRAC
jgi:hypothetical protein